ncbi:hypothetical protein F5Y05DRAFT_405000 [Hypoxylon sp. FL0543]|nr:hypothetical protein F5Y05DRAFT_405000 [Hypoxylon sp. FL0543]
MYGCSNSVAAMVTSRLSKCKLSNYHPLTLPMNMGISTHTSMSTQSVSSGSEKLETSGLRPMEDRDTVLDWLELNHIRGGLRTWQTQLKSLVQHLPKLERIRYGPAGENGHDEISEIMKNQGVRIKERLAQIINKYDEKVRDCSTVIDGMTFATQMIARAHTRTNLSISKSTMQISKATQRDGSQMRSIALLTMIFLSGTFVATLFSISFFNWKLEEEDIMSPYIWIYAVITLILTILTIGVWHRCTARCHSEKSGIFPL